MFDLPVGLLLKLFRLLLHFEMLTLGSGTFEVVLPHLFLSIDKCSRTIDKKLRIKWTSLAFIVYEEQVQNNVAGGWSEVSLSCQHILL